jgi:hypothetical protein
LKKFKSKKIFKMDPVGPWSYTYNRLATVQPTPTTPSSGDFHHHLATIAAATAHNASIGGIGVPSSGSTSSSSPGASVQRTDFSVHPATSQLLLQSGFSASNFLASPQAPSTPSNIAYETVFSPFLHAAPSNPKPAHYNNIQTSHRHRTDAYQQPTQQQHLALVSQQQQPQSSRTR